MLINSNHPGKGVVILLHGLARSSASMNRMQKAIEAGGFKTCNISYPSTRYPIQTLARNHVLPKIKKCVPDTRLPIHFVTHSMGGIIVRYLAKQKLIDHMGRVVMLSPPNKGSEVVDVLGNTWFFKLINGPAGNELCTREHSLPSRLGPANFELGIITGNKSINLILSMMIKGKNDGKVSVKNARLDGMKDFIVIAATHPFIMKNAAAIKQTIHFLNHGVFNRELKENKTGA